MQTTDAGLLFQTTSSLTAAANHQLKVAATSRTGSPIHLSGKVLDLEIRGHKAWTAESGWLARCLDLTVSGGMSEDTDGCSQERLCGCTKVIKDQ